MKTLLLRIARWILAVHLLQCVGQKVLSQSLVVLNPVLLQHIPLNAGPELFVNYYLQLSGIPNPDYTTNSAREYLVPSPGIEVATDDTGTVILMRSDDRLNDYIRSIRWLNDTNKGNLIATMIVSRDHTSTGRTLFDCKHYDNTNCLYGYLDLQTYRYTGNAAFTNDWKTPLFVWYRHPANGGYLYGWICLNRQLYYGYGGPIDGISIHGSTDTALSPIERLVFGPWVELKEGDEKVSGRPILPERKMSVRVQRGTTNSPPLVMVQVPPELCLKYELAVGNLKYGFASRHFNNGTPDRNRYTRSEPYSYALAVAVDSDYPFEWSLTLGRFDLRVTDEVWFLMNDNEFFVRLIPHVQYPQEKFLLPP